MPNRLYGKRGAEETENEVELSYNDPIKCQKLITFADKVKKRVKHSLFQRMKDSPLQIFYHGMIKKFWTLNIL